MSNSLQYQQCRHLFHDQLEEQATKTVVKGYIKNCILDPENKNS